MKGQHAVPLRCSSYVFAPGWALSMVVEAAKHVAYSPYPLHVRYQALTALRTARAQILASGRTA